MSVDREKRIIPQECPKCGVMIEELTLACNNCGEPIVPIIAEENE